MSGVADFGGYHNGNILGSGVDGTLSTYLFGPRFSYRSYHHFKPFAETLFGAGHAGASIAGGANGSQNAFAMAIGGGVDYRISNRFSIRPLQVDYLLDAFFGEGTPSTIRRRTICEHRRGLCFISKNQTAERISLWLNRQNQC